MVKLNYLKNYKKEDKVPKTKMAKITNIVIILLLIDENIKTPFLKIN